MNQEFPQLVDKHLARLGWNRRKLALESGIAEEYISRMMNGHRPPSADHTHKIADTLRLGPEDYQELHTVVARMHGFAV